MPPGLVASPTDELRQGDVCCVDRFPQWTLASTNLSLPGVDKTILAVDQPKKLARSGDQFLACVCSYDCELENKVDRSGVLLAPVRLLPAGTSRVIKESWRPIGFEDMTDDEGLGALSEGGELSFANYNMFPMRLSLNDIEQDVIVDFAAMASLADPKNSIPALLLAKRFELNDAARQFFQLKIALFMARPG